MNNKIRLAVTALIAAVLVMGLFVACDNNVITSKNNGYAYTEILATNGSFVYNGNSYDFLEDALKAIESSGAPGTIRLSGNVSIYPITIPTEPDITLDLNGHSITFRNVEDSGAVVVSDGAVLSVENGTLSLTGNNRNVPVITTAGSTSRTILANNVAVGGYVVVEDFYSSRSK